MDIGVETIYHEDRGEGLNTTKPLTADEARAAAAAEGLELVPSSKNQTGFKGVTLTHGRYYVNIYVHVHCSISTKTALSRSDRPMLTRVRETRATMMAMVMM